MDGDGGYHNWNPRGLSFQDFLKKEGFKIFP